MEEFITVVGVKFRDAGRIYYYNTGGIGLKKDDKIVVNTPIGLELGIVVISPTLVPKEKAHAYNILEQKMDNDYVLGNLSPATLDGSIDSEPKVPEQLEIVIRKATEQDLKDRAANEKEAAKANDLCAKLIKDKKLPMKLVTTELTLNGKKAVFYFTSNGRVDFRELVKDLLKDLKLRIELRQIDMRDETKIMSGVGPCGNKLCCSCFLRQFKPVSIKMAKEQNLALNPTKVSGVCGRLLCCLAYEVDTYNEIKKDLPKVGTKIKTAEGEGKIFKVDIFSSKLDILLDSGEMIRIDASSIKELEGPKKGVEVPVASDIAAMIKEAAPEGSEEELKALEDPKEVIDIKDTFMKPASPSPQQRQHQGQHHGQRPYHDKRGGGGGYKPKKP